MTSPGAPFRVQTDEETLRDLRQRLERARFPRQQAGADWKTGTPLSYAKRLRDYWLSEFDWRAWEARINEFDQRIVDIDGQRIHVVVERGSGKDPLPLIMTHGWPGSFLEFIDLIDVLAHPEKHGGLVEDAFTVVVPSLPGYGFSPAPAGPLAPPQIAALWSKLMTESFGFDRYIAYGSDWGSLVTAQLALNHTARLSGTLMTTPGFMPANLDPVTFTQEEIAWQQRMQQALAPETAYQAVQGTKPQSLAYGLTDSPLALACWIIEKFQGWTVPGSTQDPPFSMNELIANVMLYWLNGSLAPMWLYMFLDSSYTQIPAGRKVELPAGFVFAPNDLFSPAPRSWIERSYSHVVHYRVAPGGGHFPGMDNSALLVSELREFSRGALARI